MKKKKFWAYDRLQVSDHSLEGYSHRERWSRTRWRITMRRTMKNYFEKNDEELLREERWRFTSRRTMKIYFEKIINEERGRKIRVHCRWQAPENKLDIYSHRESGFKNPMIFGHCIWSQRYLKSKIKEVERNRSLKKSKIESKLSRSRRLKKSKLSRSRRLKKSKIKEFENRRSRRFEVWRLNPSLRLK
jgi:hypothetical protein